MNCTNISKLLDMAQQIEQCELINAVNAYGGKITFGKGGNVMPGTTLVPGVKYFGDDGDTVVEINEIEVINGKLSIKGYDVNDPMEEEFDINESDIEVGQLGEVINMIPDTDEVSDVSLSMNDIMSKIKE